MNGTDMSLKMSDPSGPPACKPQAAPQEIEARRTFRQLALALLLILWLVAEWMVLAITSGIWFWIATFYVGGFALVIAATIWFRNPAREKMDSGPESG